MALAADGRTLAAGTSSGMLHLFDLSTTEPRERGEFVMPRTRGPVQALAFAPDGQALAVSVSGRLVLWDMAAMQPQQEWELPGVVTHLTFGPEGRHLITANSNGTVYVLRLARLR
jgi:WD40 repeat protein